MLNVCKFDSHEPIHLTSIIEYGKELGSLQIMGLNKSPPELDDQGEDSPNNQELYLAHLFLSKIVNSKTHKPIVIPPTVHFQGRDHLTTL